MAMISNPHGKQIFVCGNCGYISVKWLGKCPECLSWDTMVEKTTPDTVPHGPDIHGRGGDERPKPVHLSEIPATDQSIRIPIGINELDRVLGGGMVPGSLILLGGEPGIGKSTLLLQALSMLAGRELDVLYVSGEESAAQIGIRSQRLKAAQGDMLILCESNMDSIIEAISESRPDVLAVDSIQTLFDPRTGSIPGSISQVKNILSTLMQISKAMLLPVIIIGHVTKEGAIAGPRALEHMVDTVLYFEGERTHSFRILRTVKNRFGPTHEIGVFEMTDSGLSEVRNPSNIFMKHRVHNAPGSVIVPCLEGSRPILVEIQALVNQSYLAMPRRTTSGIDANRLALLTAVAERHLGINFYDKDIFVNVAGGFRLSEPAADLPLICALVSSLTEKGLGLETAVFGEVGLTGEVRPVGSMQMRINEAARLGIDKCLIPEAGTDKLKIPGTMKISKISMVYEIGQLLMISEKVRPNNDRYNIR